MGDEDRKLAAFRRLLADAHQGGQAMVDALLALSQRTLFVVPWPGGVEGYRTLVNSSGVAALPIFTSANEVTTAANRYGWLDAKGNVFPVEIGARAALNYAAKEQLAYVVVDIAAEHSLEVAREEFEPLTTAAAGRDADGPYAGAGKISSSLIKAVRSTPPPPPNPDGHDMPSVGNLSAPPVPTDIQPPALTASTDFDPSTQARFGGGTSVTVSALREEPSDAVCDGLTTVLRNFPEVEWACFFSASRGPSAAVPAIGVRVDTGFRQRINELIREVRAAADQAGAVFDVVLLDDATLMRAARAQGTVFYPWRKK